MRVNQDMLQVCQSGRNVEGRILNERDPLITRRCQVRVRYQHDVYSNCLCRGHVVLQTRVLPEKVVAYDEQTYDGRIVGFESPCAFEPVAAFAVEPLVYVVLIEQVLQMYLAYAYKTRPEFR